MAVEPDLLMWPRAADERAEPPHGRRLARVLVALTLGAALTALAVVILDVLPL